MLPSVKNKKQYWLSLFFCTICICIPAFINNFPFIYSDTGTYLGIGFTDDISYLRPLAYGIFLRHVSLHESLWIVILVQAFIVSWFIHLFVNTFFKHNSPFNVLLIVSILTATTSVGVTTSMLMPDFTTPILFLATSIILFSKTKNKWVLAFCFLGLWFTIASHHSHAYILCLTLFGMVLKKIFFWRSFISYGYKRFILILFILAVGYYTIPTLHYLRIGKFVSSKSSNVFLMGRFNQMGLLKPFLDEYCPNNNYSICKYKDTIPESFLWSKKSPVRLEGTWSSNNELYKEVVHDFLWDSYYLKKFVIKSLETWIQQIFYFDTVKLIPIKKGKWPHFVFVQHMPDIVPALMNSAQTKRIWSSSYLDFIQKVIVFSSGLILIYLFFFQNSYIIPIIYRDIAFLILLGLLSNAFICGGISMISSRFQSRIIWLLPFFTFFLCHYLWVSTLNNQNPA